MAETRKIETVIVEARAHVSVDELTRGWTDEEKSQVQAMDGDAWAALCDSAGEWIHNAFTDDRLEVEANPR